MNRLIETIRNIFKIEELRKRILFTVLIILIYRFGSFVVIPGIDPDTAERLEQIAFRSLVRRNGMLYLDVGRDWRIGATANFIISRAYANGASFRRLCASSIASP